MQNNTQLMLKGLLRIFFLFLMFSNLSIIKKLLYIIASDLLGELKSIKIL